MTETPYYDEYKRRRNLKLSQDPNTPVEVLEVLSTDEDFVVRCNVANNPNTPVEVLRVLSTDEDYYVRYWVANNPNTPKNIYSSKSTNYLFKSIKKVHTTLHNYITWSILE